METNLTERQLLVWLDHQVGRGVPSNNMVATFRIDAVVDGARFQCAFRSVVSESDALRTVFETREGVPQQRVLAEMDAETELVDLSREEAPDRAFQLWSDERRQRCFRIEARSFDSVLVRLGESRFVWYLCLHHLITDAWSFSLVYQQTLRAYLGEASPPLPQFAEHVEQAARYRASTDHARSEAFWRRRLAVALPPARFYGGTAAPRDPYFERHTLVLDERRTAGLAALGSRATEASPRGDSDAATSTALMALVFAYLYRVTGNRLLGIGCPFVNRSGKRLRQTIGSFMEVCPLRIEVDEGDSFRAVLGKTRRDLLEILPHARHAVPNPTTQRAFEVMVNFHTARFASLLGPTHTSLSTGTVGLHPDSVREALGLTSPEGESFVVTAHDWGGTGRLSLSLDFRADLLDPRTRSRAPEHFVRLLDAFIADPDRPIDRVPMVGDEERDQLLVGLGRTFPPEGERPTLIERLYAQVREAPHRVAVRHGAEALDYAGLGARVDALARRLERVGLAAEQRVAIRLARSIDMLVAMLGTLKAGGAYVPLDPAHPEARVTAILDDSRPTFLLTSTALRDSIVRTGLEILCIDDGVEDPPRRDEEPPPRLGGEQLAYVIFTSGSTGRPKGVEVTHRALANLLESMAREPGLRAGDTVIALTTIAFDIAALELFLPLTVGGTVEIVDHETATDGAALAAILAARPSCVVQATPATWRLLLESGWKGSPSLRVLVGGETLPPDLARHLSARAAEVWNMYGPTETTVWSTIHRVSPPGPGDASTIPIGLPIDNTSVLVLGADRELLPIGVVGELYIGGDGVARGYHGRPDLTEERFVPDPFSLRPDARMYRTGDLASISRDGVLRHHGRADRQIKLRGFRIEPAEIESVLRAHSAVADAAVMIREVHDDARLVAYVACPDAAPSVAALRAHVSHRLPDYMVPTYFVLMPELPRTPNGKIDLLALPPPSFAIASALDAGSHASGFEGPATDRELQLAAIWQELLGVPRVGRRDDFFVLGGHSLLAVRVATRIRQDFGVELSIRAIFEHPTLEALAAAIGDTRATGPALVPLQSEGTSRPIYFVCGLNLYRELALSLGRDQPSYGVFLAAEEKIAAAVAAGRELPEVSVADMAADYLAVIRAHQPRGPYRLAGVSFGGVLAFEVAQRLRAMDEQVELLALFDSILPRGRSRSPIRAALARLRSVVLGGRTSKSRAAPNREVQHVHDVNDLRQEIYLRAIEAHDRKIKAYPGSLLLFRALDRETTHAGVGIDPWCGWRDVIQGEIEIIDVPGDHLSILRPPSAHLVAEAIRGRLCR